MLNEIHTKHHFNSGVYSREMHLPAGWQAESHSHKFNHMSILASGKVKVTVDGVESIHIAPAVLSITAGKIHSILGIEDSVWFCVHATDEIDIEKLEQILIEEV